MRTGLCSKKSVWDCGVSLNLGLSAIRGKDIRENQCGVVGSAFFNPIKHGVRQVAISWGGVQSARSLIGLSRDLIRPFHGHHTPLYSVGVYYGASRNKIFKKSWKKVEFSQFFSDNPIFGKN